MEFPAYAGVVDAPLARLRRGHEELGVLFLVEGLQQTGHAELQQLVDSSTLQLRTFKRANAGGKGGQRERGSDHRSTNKTTSPAHPSTNNNEAIDVATLQHPNHRQHGRILATNVGLT